MKINTLLKITVTAVMLAAAANFAGLYFHNRNIASDVDGLAADQRLTSQISEILSGGLETGQQTRAIVLNPNDAMAKKSYLAVNEQVAGAFDKAEKMADPSALKAEIGKLRSQFAELRKIRDAAQTIAVSGEPSAAVELMNKEEIQLWRQIKKSLKTLLKQQEEAVYVMNARTSKGVFVAQILNGVSFLLMALIMLSLWLLFQKKVIKPITYVVEGLLEGAAQVDAAAGEVAKASQSLAEGASEQASALGESSAAIGELSSMTSKNGENAHQANGLMSQTGVVIDEANQSMRNLTRAMNDIASESENMAKNIVTIQHLFQNDCHSRGFNRESRF
jgi:methyl-accepting chemotaxis protein